jgi:hypothetical protein
MNTSADVNLSPAPMATQEQQSYTLVLICGLVTTALALFGVYLLNTNVEDFHIMGWYANYVLPIGALIVGLVAASGYGLASWFSGIKITRGLLWAVVVLQLAAYFAAQYIEFASHKPVPANGDPVSFFEYLDFAARSFAWKQKDGSTGQPLGAWGYAFRALEVLGFVAGGLIVPALMRKAPYCDACRRYMRKRQLGLLAASVPARKVKKSDAAGLAAYQAEQEQAFDNGKRACETLRQLAETNQVPEFQNKLADFTAGKKKTALLPRRLSLHLVHCTRCCGGWLQATLWLGQGREQKQSEYARQNLHPEFVRALLPGPTGGPPRPTG